MCECHTGWIKIDSGTVIGSGTSNSGCADIDECKTGTHECSKFARCVNTLGLGSTMIRNL